MRQNPSILGVGVARLPDPKAANLEELVFTAASAALKDAGIGRDQIDGVSIAGSDQLDGRSISSMQLAGPAGAFHRDEVKAGDDGSLALATAALRLASGIDQRVLVVSWFKGTESNADSADEVIADPVYTRPLGLFGLVPEAALSHRFAGRHGIKADDVDRLSEKLRRDSGTGLPGADGDQPMSLPIRSLHVPEPTDGAVALVLSNDPGEIRLSGLSWAMDDIDIGGRAGDGTELLRRISGEAAAQAGITVDADLPVETTDRNAYRLCMSVGGLGLVEPADSARALADGELPRVNPGNGLWSANPVFAAGLECVVRAVEHVREGAESALAHSSYGVAGQGQLVAVVGREGSM